MKKFLALFLTLAALGTYWNLYALAADDTVYFAHDYEDCTIGKYKSGIELGDLYAGWGENEGNSLEIMENPFDASLGKSLKFTGTALYSSWELADLFHTKESTIVLDMQFAYKKMGSMLIAAYFEGSAERGDMAQLAYITDFNGRGVIKVGPDGVGECTADLKKKQMNRVTFVVRAENGKNSTVQTYLDGKAVSEKITIPIKGSMFRFSLDSYGNSALNNEIIIDNLVVSGVSGDMEDYFKKPFPGNTENNIKESEKTPEPTAAPEPTKEPPEIDKDFKPEKDPNGKINVYVNNEKIDFDVSPMILNDRTMVPMRKIFEALGADIDWNEVTSTVTGTKDDKKVKIKIGAEKATINGAIVTLDQPAVIQNDRTLVPVRVISEGLGAVVQWDEETKSVLIAAS